MPVDNRNEEIALANRMRLRMLHFARGTYPEADGKPSALPLNRFFIPLDNPAGDGCYVEDSRRRFTLRPGCAYFIPIAHTAAMKLDTRLTFVSIQFTLEIYGGVDLFSRYGAVRELRGDEWARRAETAFGEPDSYASASLLRGLTQEFIARLLKEMEPGRLDFVTRFAEFRVELDYIRQHAKATTTVERLASLRGMRREVFSRNFTKATGMSPKRFLNRTLLNRACALLLRGDLRVGEVANELGFANEFYFSRFFKKHSGIPPTKFRAKHLNTP